MNINVPPSRKGIVRFLFIALILTLFIAVFVIIAWGIRHKTLDIDELADLNEVSQDEVSDGMPIKGSIYFAFDAFAEEYETTTGALTTEETTKLYYIVPVHNFDSQGFMTINYLLVYECEPKNFDKMDTILEQTYSDTQDLTNLQIESGIIEDLPYDLVGFFNGWQNDKSFYENGSFIDWCIEYDIFGTADEKVVKEKIIPYMIVDSSGSLDAVWVLLPIAGVLFVIMMFFIMFKKKIKFIDSDKTATFGLPPDIKSSETDTETLWK